MRILKLILIFVLVSGLMILGVTVFRQNRPRWVMPPAVNAVAAATNNELPFLGLAYASERVRSESTVEPAGGRLRPPPGRIRVEIMELVAHGTGARPTLGSSTGRGD